MKILDSERLHELDRMTMQREGISASDLIGRVARQAANEIQSRWQPSTPTVIFAGPGNNGADALALATELTQRGFRPTVYLFNIGGNKLSPDCRAQRDMAAARIGADHIVEVTGTTFSTPHLDSQCLVVDGLFGSGLRDPLMGGFMALVRYINESGAKVVSLDMPSGLFCLWNNNTLTRNVVHADITLAVGTPRLPFMLSDYSECVGRWQLMDIGLSADALRELPTEFHYVEGSEIRGNLRRRPDFCSKDNFGCVTLVAGSYGMMGAAVLASRACLRAGAGRVTVHAPQCGYEILQTAVPEAMFDADRQRLVIGDITPPADNRIMAVGPGIGTNDTTIDALETLIKQAHRPLILDADALNCLARRPMLLDHLPVLSLLTPHAREFDRIFEPQPSDEARLIKAIEVSRRHNILILLKGHYSALVRPDGRVYFNSSGTPALATPGSGDVLTGIIAAFMAQGHKPEVSAIIASYIHGLAGQLAQRSQGTYSVTASDIVDHIGPAILSVINS